MGSATAVAVRETKGKTKVSQAALDAARERAVELCRLAYSPQEIKQPDGTVIFLCWNGRTARGYERLAQARLGKEEREIRSLENALAVLSKKAQAADEAAVEAASTWAAMCAAAGVDCNLESVYPKTCRCEGCRAQMAHHDKAEARATYARALYALLAPNSHDLPPIMALGRQLQADAPDDVRKEAQRHMSVYLQRIYEAGQRWMDANTAAGTLPNWRQLWPDEADE